MPACTDAIDTTSVAKSDVVDAFGRGLFTTAAGVCDQALVVAVWNDSLTAVWLNAVDVAAIGSIHDPFPTSCTRVLWDFPSFPV